MEGHSEVPMKWPSEDEGEQEDRGEEEEDKTMALLEGESFAFCHGASSGSESLWRMSSIL